jgi:hypothetical protein
MLLRNLVPAVSLLAASLTLHADPQVDVIATGLNNPRGIGFAPNGTLYVAEAGSGGNGGCLPSPEGGDACYGETGALTRVDPTGARGPVRVIGGLPSMAGPAGFGAIGPHDVSFLGGGNAHLTIGFGADGPLRSGLGPKSSLLGSVLEVGTNGHWKKVADLAGFETANNPVVGGADSDPFGALTLPSRTVIADAGGNDLVEIRANGTLRVLATFPPTPVDAPPFLGLPPGTKFPMEAVPTTVVRGPDGALYVGQLTGFPFVIGAANVYRVPAHGGTPQIFASGFTNIIDIAFDAAGTLYVLQIGNGLGAGGLPLAPPGQLVRVNPDGSQTVIYDQLFYPGGLAIGDDGAAYVTNFGIVPGRVPGSFPDGGTVVRITLD